jgi:hypothetical protein
MNAPATRYGGFMATGRLFHREPSRLDGEDALVHLEFTDACRTKLVHIVPERLPATRQIRTGGVFHCEAVKDGDQWELLTIHPIWEPLPRSWKYLPDAACEAWKALRIVVEGLETLREGPLAEFVSEVLWEPQVAVTFVTAQANGVPGLEGPSGLLSEAARVMPTVLSDHRIPLLQREVGAVAGLFQRMGTSWAREQPFEYASQYADDGNRRGAIPFPSSAWTRLNARAPKVAGGLMHLWHFLDDPDFGAVEREHQVFQTLLEAVEVAGKRDGNTVRRCV